MAEILKRCIMKIRNWLSMVKLGLLISKTDISSRLSLVILVEFKIL